jgi:hypothetical protein
METFIVTTQNFRHHPSSFITELMTSYSPYFSIFLCPWNDSFSLSFLGKKKADFFTKHIAKPQMNNVSGGVHMNKRKSIYRVLSSGALAAMVAFSFSSSPTFASTGTTAQTKTTNGKRETSKTCTIH